MSPPQGALKRMKIRIRWWCAKRSGVRHLGAALERNKAASSPEPYTHFCSNRQRRHVSHEKWYLSKNVPALRASLLIST